MARATFTEDDLFATKPDQYSDKYVEHLLEQYKLYVQSHEKISERREGANKFFLALNSAVVGGIAAAWNTSAFLIIAICIASVWMCAFWYQAIRSYDNLNTGKFRVIHAIERRLPLALYEAEWLALGRGKDPELYRPISHLERNIPAGFIALHAVVSLAKLLAN